MKNPIGDNIKDFKLLNKIGSGGFAEVFKAKCLRDGYEDFYVAIKRISKDFIIKKKCEQRIKDEIKIHSELSHPNILKFHTAFEDNKYWYLVLELCGRGSFEEYVKRKRHLSEEEACRLIKQVINALQYLQLKQVIHRDLSLKNILLAEDSLTKNLNAKITDFGLAIKCRPNEKQTSNVGTANFMPPEVFMRKPYDFKVDCWSVGCILYALLYGAPPFDDKKRESIKDGVVRSELKFPDYASKEAIELLKNMLEKDQNYRIEIKNALQYAFFQKYEKSSKKYEIRSGDSGVNSSSSSRSASSRSSRKSERTVDRERKNNCVNKVYDENYSSGFSNSPGSRRSQSRDHSNLGYERAKSPCKTKQNIRLESQCEVPIKCRPESPLYPRYARNLIEENPAISSDNSCYNETDSNKKYGSRGTERNIITRTNLYDNIPKYSCSHDEYCLPEKNCHHKSSCSHRSPVPIHKNSNTEHHSRERERKQDVEIRNSSADNGLGNVSTPLNTIRLKPCRHTVEDAICSILNDGQVCVEFFDLKKKKKKNYVVDVCFVSCDGMEISIFKPKKKILPSEKPPSLPKNTKEVQHYSFENLPKIHWQKYQYAKQFLDIKKAQTPKIIVYRKEAKFVMMENAPFPNFTANFYDGYEIRDNGGKIEIIDQNGIHLTDEKELDDHVELFKAMKKNCYILERDLENRSEFNVSLGIPQFPVTYGRPNSDDSKENSSPRSMYSSSLNRTIAMKSYSGTVNTDCSPLPNTSPASMPSPLSNRKGITTEKTITDVLPTLKSDLVMKKNCYILERDLENRSEFNVSLGIPQFPVTYGRPNSDDSKENSSPRSMYSSSLNRTIAMKSYSGTVNTDCSPLPNTSPASMPSPLSNRKGITTEKTITDVLPTLKSDLVVIDGWVIADYEDGIQMYISLNKKDPIFHDIHTKQHLSTDEHPELMMRFHKDLSSIVLHALSKVQKTK